MKLYKENTVIIIFLIYITTVIMIIFDLAYGIEHKEMEGKM